MGRDFPNVWELFGSSEALTKPVDRDFGEPAVGILRDSSGDLHQLEHMQSEIKTHAALAQSYYIFFVQFPKTKTIYLRLRILDTFPKNDKKPKTNNHDAWAHAKTYM